MLVANRLAKHAKQFCGIPHLKTAENVQETFCILYKNVFAHTNCKIRNIVELTLSLVCHGPSVKPLFSSIFLLFGTFQYVNPIPITNF